MEIKLDEFSKPCNCGRQHSIYLKSLKIGKNALTRLPEVIRECELEGSPLVVCDENTYKAAGKRVEGILKCCSMVVLKADGLHPNERAIEQVNTALGDSPFLIAVGSGTINDITKYVASHKKRPYISVATAASMDGYVSSVAAMTLGGLKVSSYADPPVALVADSEICKQAPAYLTAAGVGDILGKYTALTDWRLSHLISGEYLCERVYETELMAVEKVAQNIDNIGRHEDEAYDNLMYALVVSGVAMQMIGNSRPASGSEHHMSHLWEMDILNPTHNGIHGEMVSVGLVQYTRLIEKIIAAVDNDIKSHVKPYKGLPVELIRKYFGDGADAVLKESNPDQMLEVTENRIIENWDKIRQMYRSIPSSEEITRMIRAVGGKYSLEMIGEPPTILPMTIRLAPFIRGRITMMRLYDTMLDVDIIF